MALNDFFRSLRKRISKDSFKEVNGFDLFYQLTYMSAVAASGISRSRVFRMSADLPRTPAAYFRRVDLISEKLGYDYARACTMVGLSVKSEAMVSLLLRLSNALTSGQPETDFLSEESLVQGEAYEKEYERDLSSLTKWTDAYAAVNISASLIVIINMTSSLIYPLSNQVLLGLVATAVFTAGITAWVLSRAAPKETIDLFSDEGPWTQRRARQLAKITVPVILVVTLLLLLLDVGLGYVVIVSSLMLFPWGIISMMAGREIDRKDREFGPFLRSLGSMAVSTGTTISEALTRIDLSSFPSLNTDLVRLRSRLQAAIDPELCWHKFSLETGSKLIGETVSIFNDAVRLGGDPDTVAFLSAEFSARTIMLRAKRKVVASTFSYLTVVMHAAVATLLILMLEIVRNFVDMLAVNVSNIGDGALDAAALGLPSFSGPQIVFLQWTTVFLVLVLALINSFAIISTDGGHKYKVVFFVALMLLMSGVSFVAVPPLMERLF